MSLSQSNGTSEKYKHFLKFIKKMIMWWSGKEKNTFANHFVVGNLPAKQSGRINK